MFQILLWEQKEKDECEDLAYFLYKGMKIVLRVTKCEKYETDYTLTSHNLTIHITITINEIQTITIIHKEHN